MKKSMFIALCATALATEASAAGFRFGLTATSGARDLDRAIEANNPRVSVNTSVPIGLFVAATFPVGESWAIGTALGPIIVGRGDASYTIVPVGVDVRYVVSRSNSMSTYARLGVERAFANGDFVDSGSAGAVAAIGLEFQAPGRSGWGLEVAGRTMKVDVPGSTPSAKRSVRPYKGSLSVFWSF